MKRALWYFEDGGVFWIWRFIICIAICSWSFISSSFSLPIPTTIVASSALQSVSYSGWVDLGPDSVVPAVPIMRLSTAPIGIWAPLASQLLQLTNVKCGEYLTLDTCLR